MLPSGAPPTIRQETLTTLAEVRDEPGLRAALDATTRAIFADPSLGIHFARIGWIPRDPELAGSSAWLLLESNFDTVAEDGPDPGGAREAHVAKLAAVQLDPLRHLLRCCREFPDAASSAAVADYLKRGLVTSTASYQGHVHRDLSRIRLEQRLRDVILSFLEIAPAGPPHDLFVRIRKHVRAAALTDPLLAGLDIDAPAPALPDPAVRSAMLREPVWPWVRNVAPALPLVPRIPAIVAWDGRDVAFDVRENQEAWTAEDRRDFSAISATEDHGTQNALTHVVPLRTGTGRLAVLEHAHAYLDRMSKDYFAYVGQLGGIPSIHFAKWLLIEGGRRLLFLSNYDGSWESYLGDFVDQAAKGLNLAWACTKEYPHTRLLALEGATDEETFKSWGRAYQVPTQVFYSAYPELTIEAVGNNTWIRHRLHQAEDGGTLDAWFRRLT